MFKKIKQYLYTLMKWFYKERMIFMEEKFNEILQLFCIENPEGYSVKDMEKIKQTVGELPEVLEKFYLKCGNTTDLRYLQDNLIFPNEYPYMKDWEYIIFFDENQGVCQAGIKKTDVKMSDPPVYVSMDGKAWVKSSDKVSDFLVAMYGYQASICLEYSPEEFYWITKEEKDKVEQLFTKRKEEMKRWMNCSITLYGDNCHGRIALMHPEGEDDIQMNYAANTKEEYERMAKLLKGIGEPI